MDLKTDIMNELNCKAKIYNKNNEILQNLKSKINL